MNTFSSITTEAEAQAIKQLEHTLNQEQLKLVVEMAKK